MRRGSGAVILAMMLAGCLGGLGIFDPAALVPAFRAVVPVTVDAPGAEPVIAVAADGTLYIQGVGFAAAAEGAPATTVNKVWRSTDDGVTWMDVTPPGLGEHGSFDGFLAVGHGDTAYVNNVAGGTFQVWRSDDRGDSWTLLPTPRVPALMHRNWIVPVKEATLHVVMEALPPFYLATGGGPASPNEGLWYTRSDDRGESWTMPVQIDPIVNFAGQGNLVADAEGRTLYVARYEEDAGAYAATYEEGHWYLLASEDGGASWTRREMFDLTSELASAVMPLALDPAGALAFAWAQEVDGTSRVRYASSVDGGRTWTAPRDVAAAPGAQAMPWMAARGAGELGLLWYAAEEAGTAAEIDAEWFVDYAFVRDAHGASPQIAATRVTGGRVHEGNVCVKGPACEGSEDRSLLDYAWLAFGPDGRAHLVAASTEWDRPSAFPLYAGESRPFAPP